MKRIGLLLTLVCISMLGFAQTQLAVLQHNDTITNVYYGANAFASAYEASVDGDVVTLSAGQFNAGDISKAITIRGAGSREGNGIQATYLKGTIKPISTTGTICFEGVNFTDRVQLATNFNAQFIRCILKEIYDYSPYKSVNLCLINCIVRSFSTYYCNSGSTINIKNSVLYEASYCKYCVISNSYVSCHITPYSVFENCVVKNCITTYQHTNAGTNNYYADSNNSFNYCVAINMPNFYRYIGIGSNTLKNSMAEVFETFNGGTWNYYEEYLLNEDFATSFPGNDGTEVGIYGGFAPFSINPSYMIVKSCNVANKSTIDGKLSVDIEIDSEE